MNRAAARTACAFALLMSAAGPAHATSDNTSCAGQPVTISYLDPGVGDRIEGTSHDDVIRGGPRREKIEAGAGDDVVCAGGGDDTIDGGPGRDDLFGQDGQDTFIGVTIAQDILVGGEGGDVGDYSRSPVGVQVNLATHVVVGDGASKRGGIQSVESIDGSPQDDHLIGNDRFNLLAGNSGNDVIDGRGGFDALRGGAGIDRLTYASSAHPIDANLEFALVDVTTDSSKEQDSVYGFEILVGTKLDDQLVGSLDDEQIVGGDGDDVIKGLAGHDNLDGGPGNDTLYPGPGDDLVDGGPNDPVTSPGKPGDLVSYSGDTITNPDRRQFDAYLAPDSFGPAGSPSVGDDVFVDIESIRGVAGVTNIITGSEGPNVIIGGGRRDLLEGFGGNDLLYGIGGEDALEGGAGDDFLDGASPTGVHDSDSNDGGDGNDTCLGALDDWTTNCETTG